MPTSPEQELLPTSAGVVHFFSFLFHLLWLAGVPIIFEPSHGHRIDAIILPCNHSAFCGICSRECQCPATASCHSAPLVAVSRVARLQLLLWCSAAAEASGCSAAAPLLPCARGRGLGCARASCRCSAAPVAPHRAAAAVALCAKGSWRRDTPPFFYSHLFRLRQASASFSHHPLDLGIGRMQSLCLLLHGPFA